MKSLDVLEKNQDLFRLVNSRYFKKILNEIHFLKSRIEIPVAA